MSGTKSPRTPSSKTAKIRERTSSHYSGSSIDFPPDPSDSSPFQFSPTHPYSGQRLAGLLPPNHPDFVSSAELRSATFARHPESERSSDLKSIVPAHPEPERSSDLKSIASTHRPEPSAPTHHSEFNGSSDLRPIDSKLPNPIYHPVPVNLSNPVPLSIKPSCPIQLSHPADHISRISPSDNMGDPYGHGSGYASGSGAGPTSRDKGKEAEIPNFGVPDLNSCGNFDGKESAVRWLARVHWQFRRIGYTEEQIPPSEAISSVNMLCRGEAATFLDSSTTLQHIIEDATVGKATRKQLETFEQALKDRYPNKPVDTSVSWEDDLTRIAQKPDEPLAQYYSRVQNALRQAGGKDIPHNSRPENDELSGAEATLLKTVVCRFVDGLRDFKLRQESLSNRARNAKSLWQCHEIIRESQHVLEDREKAEEEEANRAEVEAIRKALSENKGLTVDEAVARLHPQVTAHYTTHSPINPVQYPPTHTPSCSTHPYPPAQSYPPRPTRPSITCFRCRKTGHYAHDCPEQYLQQVYQQQGYPQQGYQHQGHQQQSREDGPRSDAPPNAHPTPANPTSVGPYTSTRARSYSNPLPARETSKNPLINGSETLAQGEKACFRCGLRGHIQPKCEAPQRDWLAWWEQAHLKAIMFPASRYKNKGLSIAEVQSRSAQLFYEQFLDDDENLPSSDGRMDAHMEDGNSHVCSNSITIEEVPESDMDESKDEGQDLFDELESQVSVLQSLLASAEGQASKRRKDGDTTVPISTLLDEQDDTALPHKKPKKPRKPRDPNKPPKPMAEIRARKGEGPYNYKELLKSIMVPVSLQDMLQMSPDFSRNLKHLSVRASEKVKKTERRYAKMKTTLTSNSATIIHPTKAYRITPTIRYMKGGRPAEHTIQQLGCQADQGSDVNIIHPTLVNELHLERRKIRDLGVRRLFLLNSAGKSDPIDEFVVFVATVGTISRPVWAIIQPSGGKLNTLMILGLPWLWDVMATFDIRHSLLTIGDSHVGEAREQIQGPTLSFVERHRLALAPAPVQSEDEDSSSSDEGPEPESEYTTESESEN
ncbi:hypothetical protein F5Y10DRAFT_70389 [Nemania abortiva]|nr:hypothetical protein F5Y10DRAFT_70389 [Nemania abortiva]